MGVQGLWELLAPVGRRVSVETLAGKRLAVDASIWIVQFIKAVRDDRGGGGDAPRHAHLLGFLRRIAKLLFLRARPVFVFDGATPTLKRRTLAARRRLRDQARSKIRKTAEKLLLNHLKTKRLEELAEEIKRTDPKADPKGKQVASDDRASLPNQQSLDELLAASLAAEEESKFTAGGYNLPEEEEEDDEEMIYPVTMDGGIDPAVLASLPPSMQLDLLVQMREQLIAENRQRYEKIKKAPSKFSELQIQSYLKTVAFRREIDEVQKCAAGRGVGGLQTSRIASEANKEFIFSSSFTGDKQKLSSVGIGKNGDNHASENRGSLTSAKCSFSQSNSASGSSSLGKSRKDFGPDVETYYDDRGRVRVSRVRGMGIRMTRDLQRNLDLMKEYEEEKTGANAGTMPESICSKVYDASNLFSGNKISAKASVFDEENQDHICENEGILSGGDGTANGFDEPPLVGSNDAIEVCFVEEDSERKDTVDDLFHHLVSGNSTLEPFIDGSTLDSNTDDFGSDCIWEEGLVEENTVTQTSDSNKKSVSFSAAQFRPEDDEVDWEEGVCHTLNVVSDSQAKHQNAASIGLLEEEADIQEAIRRSLEDFQRLESSGTLPDDPDTSLPSGGKKLVQSLKILTNEKNEGSTPMPLDTHPVSGCSPCIKHAGLRQLDDSCKKEIEQTKDGSEYHLSLPAVSRIPSDGESSLNDETNKGILVSSHNFRTHSVVDDESLGTLQTSSILSAKSVESHLEGSIGTFKQVHEPLMVPTNAFVDVSATASLEASCTSSDKVPENVAAAMHLQDLQDSEPSHLRRKNNESAFCQKNSEVVMDTDREHKQDELINNTIPSTEESCFGCETTIQESFDIEVSEAALDKEISLLRQERKDLGDEQKRLERNAESVSSEMFAECQELLQMFGLPYIIAPMEAEAQCAYMEMKNLVDGVVTDDSDVFLFGARNVYKNIFDDRKYVETYFMKDIESELGLTREKLIRMALLLGSDYTEGVSGIGIVNAIEVVHAFPEEDGLRKFREWIESPDPSILGKIDSHTVNNLKTSCKAGNSNADRIRNNVEESVCGDNNPSGPKDHPAVSDSSKIKEIFMDKHRNVSKNWHISSSFPSELVVSAYISPQVDESTDSFSWGKPDLFLLRKLCWEKFAWSNQKADELLVPVLKEYNKHETQLRLEVFYTFNERFAKIRSQRIKKAVKGITGKPSSELMDDPVQEGSKSRTKGRPHRSVPKETKLEVHSAGKNIRDRKASNPSRRQNSEIEDMHIASDQAEGNAKSSFSADVQGRGRGRGGRRVRGGGRGRGRKRGRGQGEADFDLTEFAEASSSDDCMHSDELDKLANLPDKKPESRRSTRQRKHIHYAEEEVDIDDVCCSSIPIDRAPSGVGMVRDASDLDQVGNQNPLQESCSEDYLLSGGGFCEDETEELGDGSQPAASPMTDSVGRMEERFQNAGNFPREDDLNSPCKGLGLEDSPVLRTSSYLEQGSGEQEANPSLRAMPSLKRKRRA